MPNQGSHTYSDSWRHVGRAKKREPMSRRQQYSWGGRSKLPKAFYQIKLTRAKGATNALHYGLRTDHTSKG